MATVDDAGDHAGAAQAAARTFPCIAPGLCSNFKTDGHVNLLINHFDWIALPRDQGGACHAGIPANARFYQDCRDLPVVVLVT
ncbi:hypothetical protein TevJSym_bt00050 [endosymbiont of Tevnia jerichonana (vent Tica)]|uniref:Uncharacterized protein n=1 Tax=endosymbiont of Tevnia jerichonana (vent Tica) TaxID=1049564 RepID=G2FJN2_9GAMM|nr:hypothetical protein TevJSym_bt00050 [endosymbiont of Tevnia jerichonana (vent Tica)]